MLWNVLTCVRKEQYPFVIWLWPWIQESVKKLKVLSECPPNSAGGHLHVSEKITNNNTFRTMDTMRKSIEVSDHAIDQGVAE